MSIESTAKPCTLLFNGLEYKHVPAKSIEPELDEGLPADDLDSVEMEDNEWVTYWIDTPYVDLHPFRTVECPIPPHNPQQGLIDIRDIIWQCFELSPSIWQPPSGSEGWLTDIINSFTKRVNPKMIFPPKLGTVLSNYNDCDFRVADLVEEMDRCIPEECRCREALHQNRLLADGQYIDPYTRHVRTDDPEFLTAIGYPVVARLLNEGRNCRFLIRPSELRRRLSVMWEAWITALRVYIMEHCSDVPNASRDWACSLLVGQAQSCRSWSIHNIMCLYSNVYREVLGGMSEQSLLQSVRSIQSAYTITVCDKASERSVIECTFHYRKMVYSRLTSPEMLLVAQSRDEIATLIDDARTSMYQHIPEYKLPANDGCAIY